MFLKNRFFIALGVCVVLFAVSYSYAPLLNAGRVLLISIAVITLLDYILLVRQMSSVHAIREVDSTISLGSKKDIYYKINHNGRLNLICELIDELPVQLQERSCFYRFKLDGHSLVDLHHTIRPTTRGLYQFGSLNLFLSNPYISFCQKKWSIEASTDVRVIPSVDQMRKYEMQVFSQTATLSGIRKMREIGENDEFEHIKSYVQGDNVRSINWKATSRIGQPMVNTYQNSRSQMVYCIIDKGRSMKMPFDGLSLLDYAINTCLAISNIVLKKYDNAGLITFSDKIGSLIIAKSANRQLDKISSKLYNEKTDFKESNYELLFYTLTKKITQRSILLLFTNFENKYDLERNMPFLKSLQRKHLLIVIFFINTELIETSEMKALTKSDIYLKTFALKALVIKEEISRELNIQGIQTILTKPEDLSMNVINKYLEIKAKRMN